MGNCESSSTEKQVHPLKLNDIEQGPGGGGSADVGVPQPKDSPPVDEVKMPSMTPGTSKSDNNMIDSTKAAQINRQIEDQLIKDFRSMEKVIKLLLLGIFLTRFYF